MNKKLFILPLMLIALVSCGTNPSNTTSTGADTSTTTPVTDWTAAEKADMTTSIGMELPFINLGASAEGGGGENVYFFGGAGDATTVASYRTTLESAGFTFVKTGTDSYNDSMTRMSKSDVIVEFQTYTAEDLSAAFSVMAYKTFTTWPAAAIEAFLPGCDAPAYASISKLTYYETEYDDGTPLLIVYLFDKTAAPYDTLVSALSSFEGEYYEEEDMYAYMSSSTYLQFYDNGDLGAIIEISTAF